MASVFKIEIDPSSGVDIVCVSNEAGTISYRTPYNDYFKKLFDGSGGGNRIYARANYNRKQGVIHNIQLVKAKDW